MRRNAIAWYALGVVLAGLLPAAAQYPDLIGPAAEATQRSRPGYLLQTASNNFLAVDVRIPGVVQTIQTSTTGSNFVGWSNYRGGRALIRTTSGDPFTQSDDGVYLTQQTPYSVHSVVRLGGALVGTEPQRYEVEDLMEEVEEPEETPIVTAPTLDSQGVYHTWQIREDHPDVVDNGLVANQSITNNDGLAGNNSTPLVQVTQRYALVRDLVRIEVELINNSASGQLVGVETFINASFGAGAADGTSFFIDGYDQGIEREVGFPSANTTDPAAFRQIPTSWRSFDNPSNPGSIVGGVFRGADIETSANSAGVPDQAGFVNATLAGTSPFNYTPINLNLVGADWGVFVRWVDEPLAPGQTKRFITYFGLAGAESDFAAPYVLSAEAPFSLDIEQGDDPSTPGEEQGDNVYRRPNPFALRAYVTNTSQRPLSGVTLSAALPSGFRFAGTDTATKSVGSVPSGQSREVTWQVQVEPDARAGERTITVSATATGVGSKAVERDITVPALPVLDFPSIARRLDMVSIPYDFQNRDIQHVLDSLGTIGVTGGGNAAVARWNPLTTTYAFFPDPFVTSIDPGEGFWLFNGSLADLVLPTDRSEIPLTEQVGVDLYPSWNQIGCPFTVPVRLFDAQVVGEDNVSRTFEQAVQSGLVRPVIYEYEPNELNPGERGRYVFSGDDSTVLEPWRGYWIRVLRPVTMIFNASDYIGPFRSNGRDFLALDNGWEFSIDASSGERRSDTVRLGQDTGASDQYDHRDVPSPPDMRSRGDVRLAVAHPDWGRDSGPYLRDIQSAAQRTLRWQLVADCEAPNQDVTLQWNLRQVPGDTQLTLVDMQTGARRHLRTTSSYTFNTGSQGGSRVFQVVAQRQTAKSLQVPFMQVAPGRGSGATITWSLTTPATVDVVIESLTGRPVRVVAQEVAADAGQNSIVWDGRDDQRRPVPAGQYRCRVLVRTPDGQQAIAERMVLLHR